MHFANALARLYTTGLGGACFSLYIMFTLGNGSVARWAKSASFSAAGSRSSGDRPIHHWVDIQHQDDRRCNFNNVNGRPGETLLLFQDERVTNVGPFMVNDFGLREHHKRAYTQCGRWIFAAAVVLGWGIGLGTEIARLALAVLLALLAGGVILNVLKEELLEERQSRFWAFVAGAGG